MFIIPSYSADLFAYLSLQILKLPFRNLEEFIENGEYGLLFDEGEEDLELNYFLVRTFMVCQLRKKGSLEKHNVLTTIGRQKF